MLSATPFKPYTNDFDESTGEMHYSEFKAVDAEVFGISTQTTDYQREVASRLQLPFELLSDARLELAQALRLPMFDLAGLRLIKRLTLIVAPDGRIQRCHYPVFPPDADAELALKRITREDRL